MYLFRTLAERGLRTLRYEDGAASSPMKQKGAKVETPEEDKVRTPEKALLLRGGWVEVRRWTVGGGRWVEVSLRGGVCVLVL